MLCGKYTMIEKFRMNLEGNVNVKRSGLFLMLVKN